MLGTYFYHEILRKTVIGFGTLFNNINIRHKDASGTNFSVMKVPLAYGPMQKFLARIQQQPDLEREIAITLPRLSFEMQGIQYDPTRKTGIAQTFLAKDGKTAKKVYMPVPYNVGFELSIMSKLNDDALQIVEQILPYFQPQYNLTVNLVGAINEKRDIPVILENITMQDDYEGDFSTRRFLLYTLRFTAKTYLFGPISAATKDIVKSASVSYYSGDSKSTIRDLTYRVRPRAIKDYTGDVVTNLAEDIDGHATTFNVDSGSSITLKKYIEIGGEEMFVTKITDNKITVERGKDGTTIISHLRGAEVKGIDYTAREDSDSVAAGDDFGFDGDIT